MKCTRLNSGANNLREQDADSDPAHQGNAIEGTLTQLTQETVPVPDPSVQPEEPGLSPQQETLNVDGSVAQDSLITHAGFSGSPSYTQDAHEDPSAGPDDEDTEPLEGDGSTSPGRNVHPDDSPGDPHDWNPDDIVPHLDALRVSVDLIKGLSCATLDDDPIPADTREWLRSPLTEPLSVSKDLRLCLDLFLATINSSRATYDSTCSALRHYSDSISLLSYDQMKRTLSELTGVVPILTDMCFESCVAFVGPFSHLRLCPECASPWYYETVTQGTNILSVSRKQALTIPVGPQIQAQYRSPEAAWNMGHWRHIMESLLARLRANASIDVYDDVYCSSTLLEAAMRGDLTGDDTVLMLSIDGVQLYQSKQLDCWIYIWVLLDLAPDLCYKKQYVLPGGFIPGPNKPKNLDSFVYTGLYHQPIPRGVLSI